MKISDLDLLTADQKTVDVYKVLLKIWEHRANADLIADLTKLLYHFIDEKRVFADLEFFLPQLAHLAIHLDHHKRHEPLEMLLSLIAETSVSAALKLSFIFSAYLENYEPEDSCGFLNNCHNPFLYCKCARLLEDVERAVVYGSQIVATSERTEMDKTSNLFISNIHADTSSPRSEDSSPRARQTHSDSDDSDGTDHSDPQSATDLKHLKKMHIAKRLTRTESFQFHLGHLSGDLYFKRAERKSIFHTKQWKIRYFVIDKKILLCFKDPYSITPIRAMDLRYAKVNVVDDHPKYGDTVFEIYNEVNGVKFILRAETPEQRNAWVQVLGSQINGAPPVIVPETTEALNEVGEAVGAKVFVPAVKIEEMTPIQRKRFVFFRQMHIFIMNAVNISDRLETAEAHVRKYFLQHDMNELILPPFAFNPLVNSSDPYASLIRSMHREAHMLSNIYHDTPILMVFESEGHPKQHDTATFLDLELERYSESTLIVKDMKIVREFTGLISERCDECPPATRKGSIDLEEKQKLSSKFGDFLSSKEYWGAEGSGLQRVMDAGIDITIRRPSSGTVADLRAKAESIDESSVTSDPTMTETSSVPGHEFISPLGLESYDQKCKRLRVLSCYGHLTNWKLDGFIAHSKIDLRQEAFVVQFIGYYHRILQASSMPVWLYPYKILPTGAKGGLKEFIPNAISIDELKKRVDFPGSLRLWYEKAFHLKSNSHQFEQAMECFIASMAGYSIITYLLNIKDRHNGNILIDNEGHIIHCNFNVALGANPLCQGTTESSPWKLTKEFIEVLGGTDSTYYDQYKHRCIQTFIKLRKHVQDSIKFIEMMELNSTFASFRSCHNTIKEFESRHYLDVPDSSLPEIVENLLKKSINHVGNDVYETFQQAKHGIMK